MILVRETGDDEAAWNFAINTMGPIAMTTAALGPMLERGSGPIVTTTSVAADDPSPGLSVYGGATPAMNTLSKGIANEYAEQCIDAFIVAPGAVETQMLRAIVSKDVMPASATLSPKESPR